MRKRSERLCRGLAVLLSVSICLSQPVMAAELPDVSENTVSGEELPVDTVLEEELPVETPEQDEIFLVGKESYEKTAARTKTLADLDDPEVAEAINRALGEVIHPGMTDLQKALALYDWLGIHCTYGTGSTARDALLNGQAVCQGYYEAYALLMDAVGIESGYVRTTKHIWNLIKIDGQWYNVDVTWDGERYADVSHQHFLRSDADYAKTHRYTQDGVGALQERSAACTSTKYDAAGFWNPEVNQEPLDCAYLYLNAGGAYHLSLESYPDKNADGVLRLVYRDEASGAVKTVQTVALARKDHYKWDLSDDPVLYPCMYSSLIVIGDELYFNDAKHIYKVSGNGTRLSLFYTVPDGRYIKAFMERQGKLNLWLIDCLDLWYRTESTLTVPLPAYTWQWEEVVKTAAKVSKIKISGMSKKIAAGKSIQLTAEVSPANASDKRVTWESGNTNYATVNSKGKVTVKKAGAGKTVTITAAAKDGSGKKASYKIKIMRDGVKSIKLSVPGKSVKAGKSVKIKAVVKTGGNNANKTLKWTSGNTAYATVSKSGKVTAKKAGAGKTVTITAQATDGTKKKAKIKIKIK